MKLHERVYAEINLDHIAYNMEQMHQNIPSDTKMIGVIKTDGYGHGAVEVAGVLEKLDYVWGYAVATLDEALELAKNGIRKPALVLGCIFEDGYDMMLDHEIRVNVYMEEQAEAISRLAQENHKTAYIHIKLDTGMGRLGFPIDEDSVDTICRIAKLPNLELEGIFTHFAKADETPRDYTDQQHEKFQWMIDKLAEKGVRFPLCHCDNSAGLIDYPEYSHDMVRAGISLYGLYPSDEVGTEHVDLKPAMKLLSHIAFVKTIPAGTSISYGGTFVSEKEMRVATIPVGYGDGYPRGLSNKGYVLIHGRKAPILGRICMDQFMVDVTEIPDAKFGDLVVLVGTDGEEEIRVEDLSELSGRFPYEFICCLGKRIPRIYVAESITC